MSDWLWDKGCECWRDNWWSGKRERSEKRGAGWACLSVFWQRTLTRQIARRNHCSGRLDWPHTRRKNVGYIFFSMVDVSMLLAEFFTSICWLVVSVLDRLVARRESCFRSTDKSPDDACYRVLMMFDKVLKKYQTRTLKLYAISLYGVRQGLWYGPLIEKGSCLRLCEGDIGDLRATWRRVRRVEMILERRLGGQPAIIPNLL